MKFTKKDNLIIIGAGKVAYSLAPALSDSGYKIKVIISNKIKRAEELAGKLQISDYTDNPESIKLKKGIFIFAVPDNKIKLTAERYSKLKFDFHNSLFIHLSGSNDVSLLKSVTLKKAQTASFHIMQTFPSRRRRNIKNSFAAVETNSNDTSEYLFKLAKDLELNPFRIYSRYKTIYHLAGIFASNFINAALFQSEQLFNLIGLKQYSFNDILAPLYDSTIRNIKLTSPAKALSGPIERGDLETVKKHIREIKRLPGNKEDILNSYLALSLSLIDATKMKYGKLNRSQLKIKELLLKELSI
jgi:predicted short-subunit dehydrogenase-like oxidoreductase (DUF2520 family)